MIKTTINLTLLLFALSSQATLAAEVKAFIMGGQSNMLGRATIGGLPANLQIAQPDVLFYGADGDTPVPTLEALRPDGKFGNEFGPEVTFGRTIADLFPDTQFAIIKYAAGGTSLANGWKPDAGSGEGFHYTTFKQTVTNGLAALQADGHTTEIIGMLWHQGESDARPIGTPTDYDVKLTNFIADVRTNYGDDLPFMIGEIRRDDIKNELDFAAISDAQQAVGSSVSNATFVPAADLTFSDRFHFNTAGQIALGERFAQGYASHYASHVPEPSSLVYLGLGGLYMLSRRRKWLATTGVMPLALIKYFSFKWHRVPEGARCLIS